MLVISGIFLFSSRDIGYLGNLIKGIFSNFLEGIWDTFLFTSRDIGYWYPPIQASYMQYALRTSGLPGAVNDAILNLNVLLVE